VDGGCCLASEWGARRALVWNFETEGGLPRACLSVVLVGCVVGCGGAVGRNLSKFPLASSQPPRDQEDLLAPKSHGQRECDNGTFMILPCLCLPIRICLRLRLEVSVDSH